MDNSRVQRPVDSMTTPEQYTRPTWCQERLHRWAMWRITVNQELIHGLEGHPDIPDGQMYQSFMDNQSLTQRYIQNPEMERDQTFYIRNAYGMPPSPKYPMGDTLYLLYGLPRVSATVRVPDVIASHYDSMSNLTFLEPRRSSTRDKDGHDLVSKSETQVSKNLLQGSAYKYRPAQSVDGKRTASNSVYPARNKTSNTDKIIQREIKPGHESPVNFRDKPEMDFQHARPTEHSGKVNNINKPVLVPPSVFQNEVLKRSNIDLPLNINGEGDDTEETNDMNPQKFEDPRLSRFNARRQSYTWSDSNNGYLNSSGGHIYVDESHMKTHM